MKPRILIPLPTSADHDYNTRSIANYADAVRQAGGDPVELPLSLPPNEVLALARTAQGILLPGSGADVDPARYGQPRQPECADADLTRESIDNLLIEHAERTRTPLLCVCFGTQSLNVYRGGTLIQHLAPIPVNHSAGKAVSVAHAVDIAPESHLGRIVAHGETTERNGLLHLNVNSSHHQAIGVPGEGLRIVARSSEDNVIEAIENDPAYRPNTQSNAAGKASSAVNTTAGNSSSPIDKAGAPYLAASSPDVGSSATEAPAADKPHWLLALQWHPERTTDISPTSRAIFSDFIQAASTHSLKP